MVMSKVSKAIAASFLCLTINAGGATNAMNAEPKVQINKENKEIKDDNINMIASQKKDMIDVNKDMIDVNVVGNKQNVDDKQDNENNNNDDNKDKKTDIWKILIPVFAGVGGLIVGALLGKFAF